MYCYCIMIRGAAVCIVSVLCCILYCYCIVLHGVVMCIGAAQCAT